MSWKEIDKYPGRDPKNTREWIANILDVVTTLKGTDTYFEDPGTDMKKFAKMSDLMHELSEKIPHILNAIPKCIITAYGAVGDYNGVSGTNNTNPLKTAIMSLANYYGKVFIPEGKYLLDGGTIHCDRDHMTIEGAGSQSTILYSKNVSTLFSKKVGGSITFKDFTLIVDSVGDDIVKLFDMKAVDTHFKNVVIIVNPLFDPASLNENIIINMEDCPLSSLHDVTIKGTLIPAGDHVITGELCNTVTSTAIVSNSNELINFSNIRLSNVRKGIEMINEEGSSINGLILDSVYSGVVYEGISTHNTISGIRYKTNIESTLQIPNPDEVNVCAVYYGEKTTANTLVGRTHENYTMLHPHNGYVIDLGEGNKYDSNIQSKVYNKFPINQLIVNNNFKYWKNGFPINWSPISQIDTSITMNEIEDVNYESGQTSYVNISGMTENLSGIQSSSFIYDPDIHGNILNVSFKAKLKHDDTSYKLLICDHETDSLLIGFSLPSVANMSAVSYPCEGKWDRYNISGKLNTRKKRIVLKLVCIKDDNITPKSLDITDIQVLTGNIGASEYPLINNYTNLNDIPDDNGNYLHGEQVSLNPATGFLNGVFIIPPDSIIGRWIGTNPVQCLRYI